MTTHWHRELMLLQYIPRNVHTGFALLCFVVVIHWLIFPYPSGLLHDCPSASKATLMNVDKYFMWIHYERLHSHNKAKHNKTVCIFLGIYCKFPFVNVSLWDISSLQKFMGVWQEQNSRSTAVLAKSAVLCLIYMITHRIPHWSERSSLKTCAF